jgi:hypothetical protein
VTAPDRSPLSDERAIIRQVWTYCRAVDRCDEALLRSVYHDDGYDDHGNYFRGPATEYVPWVLDLVRRRFISTMHSVSNILVALDGDTATVESYLVAYHVVAGSDRGGEPLGDEAPAESPAVMRIFGARYVDRFDWRPAAGWRIAHRTVVAEWQTEHRGQLVGLPAGMATATRDRTDLSYSAVLPAGS